MIFFFGSGRRGGAPFGLLLMLGLFLLLSLSGGDGLVLFPLLMIGLFFALPFLLFRAVARSASRGVLVGGAQPSWPPSGRGGPAPAQPRPVDPADVRSLLDRLAHDVSTLEPGDDPVSRQAMADASERYATASGQLERASSQDQLRTAWLAAVEGLHATRLVRTRTGLDPGPAPALPPGTGPQLTHRARVSVDGREHVGSPAYEPGRPHWFPGGQLGGQYVPGGWYPEPFWPGSMVLGVLSGYALGSVLGGGLLGGYGYGTGYGDAYADGGWGDGGGDVGGGDWGTGGGDWGGGGDFGGGDWGGGDWGGFGDVGGGDFGGGDW